MKKTIVIDNSIIVFVADNGADRDVCGGRRTRTRVHPPVPARGDRHCQDKEPVHQTQADTTAGQLRAGCFPMACRRDYRNRGYVTD